MSLARLTAPSRHVLTRALLQQLRLAPLSGRSAGWAAWRGLCTCQQRAQEQRRAGGAGGARQHAARLQAGARCIASAAASEEQQGTGKKKVVFCGTPEVAALVLERLLAAAAEPGAGFEVAAVVAQPGRPRGRGNKAVPMPSEVEALARKAGFSDSQILRPEKATDRAFLDALRALGPDLCVTAAYGNYLPTAFLAIPNFGTLNIHPSLLPKYRGAAPVQRALQDGVEWSGVTVAFTVKAMDAGPVLAQRRIKIDPDIQAPELLNQLFATGTELLLDNLDIVWAGLGAETAVAQDASQATHAAKISREEAALDLSRPAAALHNQVRAFAGWPGTTAAFELRAPGAADEGASSGGSSPAEQLELKIVRTRVAPAEAWKGGAAGSSGGLRHVACNREGMFIRCGDGSVLEVLELQAPGKKVMAARDFANGLRGRELVWVESPAAVAAAALVAAA